MVKRSEKTFISFRFEVKQSKKCLFRFALKRNEKIGSETKNFWKRNKAKIRYINFALVGTEKFEAKRNEMFFSREHAKRMRNGSRFASFCFETKNFFCETGALLGLRGSPPTKFGLLNF
jgi:hypothetical protein